MSKVSEINNSIYELYGDRWYTAYDDPIALLRAENRIKVPWIHERIVKLAHENAKILDVGCGAGFLCNDLAEKGFSVVGLDNSPESLQVARKYDRSGKVLYQIGDAYHLPFEDGSFDVVTSLDFLEHVERPQDVISECSRVLRTGGIFFFHTFNRHPITWLIVIKAIEFLVKNTPKNMHVIELFIKPEELKKYCANVGLTVSEMVGLRPKFTTIPMKNYFSGVVPENLEFTFTSSLMLSYMGMAKKN